MKFDLTEDQLGFRTLYGSVHTATSEADDRAMMLYTLSPDLFPDQSDRKVVDHFIQRFTSLSRSLIDVDIPGPSDQDNRNMIAVNLLIEASPKNAAAYLMLLSTEFQVLTMELLMYKRKFGEVDFRDDILMQEKNDG